MHHPRRLNVTTLMVGLKNGHMRKNLTQKWWTPEIAGEWGKKNPLEYHTDLSNNQSWFYSVVSAVIWTLSLLHWRQMPTEPSPSAGHKSKAKTIKTVTSCLVSSNLIVYSVRADAAVCRWLDYLWSKAKRRCWSTWRWSVKTEGQQLGLSWRQLKMLAHDEVERPCWQPMLQWK